jgi:hypothetical protein
LVRSLKGVQPVLDFAHIHARYGGSLRTPDDFRRVVDGHGLDASRPTSLPLQLHRVHQGGRETAPAALHPGPGLLPLLVPALSGISRECTIICETPLPTEDAVAMSEGVQASSYFSTRAPT